MIFNATPFILFHLCSIKIFFLFYLQRSVKVWLMKVVTRMLLTLIYLLWSLMLCRRSTEIVLNWSVSIWWLIHAVYDVFKLQLDLNFSYYIENCGQMRFISWSQRYQSVCLDSQWFCKNRSSISSVILAKSILWCFNKITASVILPNEPPNLTCTKIIIFRSMLRVNTSF